MPKMKQEICLRQFEPGGRVQMAMWRGYVELRGCGGILYPQTFSPQSTHFCQKYIKDRYNLVQGPWLIQRSGGSEPGALGDDRHATKGQFSA
jgi:hypothetical protein